MEFGLINPRSHSLCLLSRKARISGLTFLLTANLVNQSKHSLSSQSLRTASPKSFKNRSSSNKLLQCRLLTRLCNPITNSTKTLQGSPLPSSSPTPAQSLPSSSPAFSSLTSSTRRTIAPAIIMADSLLKVFHGYKDLMKHYEELLSAGFIDKLSSLFSEARSLPAYSANSSGFTSNLKIIITALIDTSELIPGTSELPPARIPTYARKPPNSISRLATPKYPRAQLRQQLSSPVSSRSPAPKNLASLRTLRGSCSYSSLKRRRQEDPNFLFPSSTESLDLISDFNHIRGPGGFSKDKRHLTFHSTVSPGPGAYQPQFTISKDAPVRPSFTKSGGRLVLGGPESPGPADYYPLRHYISNK